MPLKSYYCLSIQRVYGIVVEVCEEVEGAYLIGVICPASHLAPSRRYIGWSPHISASAVMIFTAWYWIYFEWWKTHVCALCVCQLLLLLQILAELPFDLCQELPKERYSSQISSLLWSSSEMLVLKALLIWLVPSLVKVVHVELADEGREVVVLEVPRENVLSELIRLLYDEAVSRGVPANNMVESGILHTWK